MLILVLNFKKYYINAVNLRKVLYDQEEIKQKNKKDDLLIIRILFLIGLLVLFYVLYEGIKREGKLSSK